jgi:hypothetical protein
VDMNYDPFGSFQLPPPLFNISVLCVALVSELFTYSVASAG